MKNGKRTSQTQSDAEKTDPPILSLIRSVQNGSISPTSLSVPDRRLCVAHLTGEGFSVAEIAEILKSADRTITRDRAAIRQANSVQASPELTGEMIGSLLSEAETSISRIRRVTRTADVAPIAKIEGEKACWMIKRDLIDRLQKLGCLPTAAHQFQGELVHHIDGALEAPDYEDIQAEVGRLELIYGQSQPDGGGDTDTHAALQQLSHVKETVARLVVSRQLRQISAGLDQPMQEAAEGTALERTRDGGNGQEQ